MKRQIKFFALLLAVSLSAGILGACTPNNSGTQTKSSESTKQENVSKEEEKADEPVKLVYSYWGNDKEITAKAALVADFIKLHPNYTIEETYTDGATYPTKLQTWFASGTAPDVLATANDVIYDFAGQGVFEDLKPHMEKDNLLKDVWADSMLKTFTYDGKIISAPHMSKPVALAYNKTVFDKAGLPYPKEGWTEEEFLNTAKKLTSGEGVSKIYGLNLTWMASELLRALYPDSSFYNVDSKTMNTTNNAPFKHTLELFTGLVKDGISPNSTETQSIGGGFETGRFAMSFILPSNIQGFDEVAGDSFEWDTVTLPVSKEYGQWQATLRADGMAISASSKQKDSAWEFVKWHTSDKEAQASAALIAIPSLLSYANSEDYLSAYVEGGNHFDKSVFIKGTAYSVGLQSAGVWGEINGILSENYDKILYKGISVDEAIQSIQTEGGKKLK